MADIDGVVEVSGSGDQSKYVNSLEIRLKSSERDIKSKEAEIARLQKQVPHSPKLANAGGNTNN